MRAFYANGVEKMHISWAVEGLPTLLHLSLFLFFGGLVIFLNNVDQEVFLWVVSWIGFFSLVYGFITLLPLIRQDSPYYSPLSVPAWFLYVTIQHVTFKFIASIASSCGWYSTRLRFHRLMFHHRGWMSGGVEKKAEEMAEEQSSKIDVEILGWTISALGDGHSLEKFVEAIPGFFNSKLVKNIQERFPYDLSIRFRLALRGFLGCTLSSNSVIDSVKLHRLGISLTAINLNRFFGILEILNDILFKHWDQVPKTVEIWHTLAPWCTSNNRTIAKYAQAIVANVLWTVRERDDRWFELAARLYGLAERDLRDAVTHGNDNGPLAILIHLTRKAFRSDLHWALLAGFAQVDIRNALPGLRNDFCTLWNELVREAKNKPRSTPAFILRQIRHLFIALHRGTDAAPTAFSVPTRYENGFMFYPLYPLCDIPNHRPGSIPHVPVPVLARPANFSDASSQTPTIVGFSIPVSPPPSRVPPSPNARSLTLPSGATPSRLTGNATVPRLRARGLVNTGSMCFANAVLQLLVHSPPFWDLFRELGDLKGPRGAGVPETSDAATPLADATLRFFEEFLFKEKDQPPPQEPPQRVSGGKLTEDEETKEFNADSSFKPRHMYNAMKEKRQLKNLLVQSSTT
jgi:Family of unknown function (DUF6535)